MKLQYFPDVLHSSLIFPCKPCALSTESVVLVSRAWTWRPCIPEMFLVACVTCDNSMTLCHHAFVSSGCRYSCSQECSCNMARVASQCESRWKVTSAPVSAFPTTWSHHNALAKTRWSKAATIIDDRNIALHLFIYILLCINQFLCNLDWQFSSWLLATVNSSSPSAIYMRQWIWLALVQIMAWRRIGTKPLSEPMLAYCQLDT